MTFLALEEASAGAVTSALGVVSLETGGTIVSEGAEMVISSAGVGVVVETARVKGVSGELWGSRWGQRVRKEDQLSGLRWHQQR